MPPGCTLTMTQNPVGGMPALARARPWIPIASSSSASTILAAVTAAPDRAASIPIPARFMALISPTSWCETGYVLRRLWPIILASKPSLRSLVAVLAACRRYSGLLIIRSALGPVWPSHPRRSSLRKISPSMKSPARPLVAIKILPRVAMWMRASIQTEGWA